LPTPSVNPAVTTRTGRVYHVDMGYEREKLAVEYDGADHVGQTRQMNIDAQRRLDLQASGWLIITVTAPMLARPEHVVRTVEEALVLRRAALKR
jgi:very-short-patch-repair endonuclease